MCISIPVRPVVPPPKRLSSLTSSYTHKFPEKPLVVLIPDFQKVRKDFVSVTAWLKRMEQKLAMICSPAPPAMTPLCLKL